MKIISTLLLSFGLFSQVFSQGTNTANPAPNDNLQLKETQYDFGKIPQGKPVTHVFEIENTGKDSLKIENIQASCGCTTPEWSHEPIATGSSKKVTVGYNAMADGVFEKYITIVYNQGKTKQVFIKGQVWRTPPDPAPANASIQLLKNINQ